MNEAIKETLIMMAVLDDGELIQCYVIKESDEEKFYNVTNDYRREYESKGIDYNIKDLEKKLKEKGIIIFPSKAKYTCL